jgi:hypothetical protein
LHTVLVGEVVRQILLHLEQLLQIWAMAVPAQALLSTVMHLVSRVVPV